LSDVDEQLAWEARHRTRAAAAAFGGAVLTFLSNVISGTTLTDAPGVSVIGALELAAEPGAVTEAESLRTATYAYLDDNAAQLLAGAFANALGFLCVAYALTYLAFATRARRPEFAKAAAYAGLVGAVLYAVFSLLAQVAQNIAISDFLDGRRTVADAEDIGGSGLLVFAQILYIPAVLALGMGLVFTGLNAMRAGLLTRFMGALGMMLGVFLVLPLLPYGATLIQVFWFAALGLLFLGRWPGGRPPAWRSGRAEPWPSAREARAQRMAGAGEPAPEPPAAAEARASEIERAKAHPSSKKRKRKRRA
jgi:hypothetical protein